MKRREAIKAVRSGMQITAAAVKFGISRTTLHRWLRAFDPDHPIASARPRKTGPRGPRWTDETITAVIDIIRDSTVSRAVADAARIASGRRASNKNSAHGLRPGPNTGRMTKKA